MLAGALLAAASSAPAGSAGSEGDGADALEAAMARAGELQALHADRHRQAAPAAAGPDAAARQAALDRLAQGDLALCGTDTPEILVLPERDGLTHVFVLSHPAAEASFPLAGHYRLDLDRHRAVVEVESVPGECSLARWGEGSQEDPGDMILSVLAQQLLQDDDACRRLLAELDATSAALSNRGGEGPDPVALLSAYRAMQGRMETLTKEVAKAQSAQSAVSLLQSQNRIMQEELEALGKSRVALDDSQAEVARLRGELDHLYRSHSFRVTAPLRRIRGLLAARRT